MKDKRKQRKRGLLLGAQPGVFTHSSQVPGTITRVKGKVRLKGSGPITGPRKNAMADMAVKLGYINEGQTISDIPRNKMGDFARDLVKQAGCKRVVNDQVIFRKNQPNTGSKKKVLIAKSAISRPPTRVLKVRR